MVVSTIYLAAAEGDTGKSIIALGLVDALSAKIADVRVFRPVTESASRTDRVIEVLLSHPGVEQRYDDAIGVDYAALRTDPEEAHEAILHRYHAVRDGAGAVVVVGSDFTDVTSPTELAFNGTIAANLGTPVLLVVRGDGRSVEQIDAAIDIAATELDDHHAAPVAAIVNRCGDGDHAAAVVARLAETSDIPVWAIPHDAAIAAPTLADLAAACDGRLVRGDDASLGRESAGFIVAAMSPSHVLERLVEGGTVIVPGDRDDLLPAVMLANRSANFPNIAGVVLTGGYEPAGAIGRLIDGLDDDVPAILSPHDTYETATLLSAVRGNVSTTTPRKIELARNRFADHVEAERLLEVLEVGRSDVVTPLMFQFELMAKARADRRHIVLPEGGDDRILEAAAIVRGRNVAELTVLGDGDDVAARAARLGLDLDGVAVLSPTDPELVERFAGEYARLRAHKGTSLDQARIIVTDVSYFGTMMVHEGLADGMVSGAAHTTAHTIKPSFEIVKTRPGVSLVSSVFLMALPDRVLVYGDCAVNPNPTAEQLADIAISSAATAEQFGITPRVAMLSYSTGSSGHGEDVERVRRATDLVRERRPDLALEGPIQYDAAVDASVAQAKLPESAVAGRATVFVFPDLNTGNNTYKAVQRSAGAVAIGPVLQGLNRPVNDLSRGATVDDIVNTIAITAVQAQTMGST